MRRLNVRKNNNKIIVFGFWFLIISSILAIAKIFFMYPNNFNIKELNRTIDPISVNFELNQRVNPSALLVCFSQYCVSPQSDIFRKVYSYRFDYNDTNFFKFKTKDLKIAIPEGYENIKIEKIFLSNKNKNYYYDSNDILKFKTTSISVTLDDTNELHKYNATTIPNINNYRGIINNIVVIFLSLFSNWTLFVIPYCWIFCAFLIYIFNKDCFNLNINFKDKGHFYILISIFLIGAFIRIQDLLYIPLWTDEIYVQTVATDSLKATFQDPGNPPLFFFLEFIITKLFSSNILTLRILPLILGLAYIPITYLIFKNMSKKLGLFAAFLASINTIFIYHSQEARPCIMCIFLSVSIIYFLFNYLKQPDNKNLILYTILNILLINSNYYLILLALSNTIWGSVDLLENKNKNKIFSFLLANFIAALSFVPYFIISGENALSKYFNFWIPRINQDLFKDIINCFFFNKYIFIFLCIIVLLNLIICFIPKMKIYINKEKENLYIYLIYSIAFVLIAACFISIFIKPIVHQRLLFNLYGLLFMAEILTIVSVVDLQKENNVVKTFKAIYFIVLLGIYLNITHPIDSRTKTSLDSLMLLIQEEAPYYHSLGYEVHGILPDYIKYKKSYPEINKFDYITWHTSYSNTGYRQKRLKKDLYTKNKGKVVIFTSAIGMNFDSIYLDPKVSLYVANMSSCAKLVTKGIEK